MDSISNTYDLSFCIPVLNTADTIAECLDSILCQDNGRIEICVVDGGSSDSTYDIVLDYVDRYPQIVKTMQRTKKHNVDADIFAAIEMASGRIAWIFSGDDVLDSNAVETVLCEFTTDIDVLMGVWVDCDINMQHRFKRFPNNMGKTGCLDLHDDLHREAYFASATLLHNIWSFCSSLIVDREWFLSKAEYSRFYGTCYALAAQMFRHSQTRLRLKWINSVLFYQRGDNDSFLANGVLNRVSIDIEGYTRITMDTFGEGSLELDHVRRVLRNQLGVNWLMKARLETDSDEKIWRQFLTLISNLYTPRNLNNILRLGYLRFVPTTFHQMLYSFYEKLNLKQLVRKPLG